MNESFENLAKLKLLLSIERIGPTRILKLLSHFGEFRAILNAKVSQISAIDSFNDTLAKAIIKSVHRLNTIEMSLEKEIKKLDRLGAKIITYWNDAYPKNLKNVYLSPLILYVHGEIIERDSDSISIVGTRKPSEYGRFYARKFSEELSAEGITIVSGLARGIDSIAHRGTLKVGGRTIAVIGSGLDVIYPPENRKLYDEIVENGAIISEFELGTKPDAPNFPRRNRIISGMSLGTLIIETKVGGGAMQTAAHALDQNREVFALPGNLNCAQAEGTNILIQKGEAKLITNITDILSELRLNYNTKVKKQKSFENHNLNFFEQAIINTLSDKPKHIDLIAEESNIATADCLVYLLNLELKGFIQQLPGKNFSIL